MSMTPEKRVKKQVTDKLKERGAYYFFPAANGMGRAGIPDIIACYKGKFIAIECKAGKNTTTALQDRELQKIKDVGGYAFVVNEDNIDDVSNLLTVIGRQT